MEIWPKDADAETGVAVAGVDQGIDDVVVAAGVTGGGF
jgi:hypothetical protein